MFITLPSYVVGGSLRMRMYSGDEMLFNVTTSLHLHRYLGGLHDILWLETSHDSDTITQVFNPNLPPAPIHAHGKREEDCRYPAGCGYRLRAGMQSLIVTSTAFTIPTPSLTPEEEARRRHEAAMNAQATAELYNQVEPQPETEFQHTHDASEHRRTFQQDESMLIYAHNLRLVVDYAQVIESNDLAHLIEAHDNMTPEEADRQADLQTLTKSEGEDHQQLTTFIAPDVLLSFHQYELSPMQHVGVSYIIRGSIMLLAAIAIGYVKWMNDQQRDRPKHH